MTATPSAHARAQYATTNSNLTARMAIHAYSTNPQDWFAWLGERLPLAGAVLEVGAGTGRLWTRIDHRGRGLDLTLTDFSAAMCHRLRTIPGARVGRCDAARLPFADAAFDTVVANHMLYHVDDPDAVLREFGRVLRPGGRVAVAVNGTDHMAELTAVAEHIGRPDLAQHAHNNDFRAETGPDYLGRHFTGVEVDAYLSDLDVPSPEPIVRYLASIPAKPLTPAEVAAASAVVQAQMDAEGDFRVRKNTVLLTAVRAGGGIRTRSA